MRLLRLLLDFFTGIIVRDARLHGMTDGTCEVLLVTAETDESWHVLYEDEAKNTRRLCAAKTHWRASISMACNGYGVEQAVPDGEMMA